MTASARFSCSMIQRRIAAPLPKDACTPRVRDARATLGSLEFGVSLTESIEEVLASRTSMSGTPHASASPTCRPTSSSSSIRRRSPMVGPSSQERVSIGSNETRGKSFADEAQTCYNILLILRTDTQHLISLRNENLSVLENNSGPMLDATSSRAALLACINESITAATRSITQLGPFLDRHRWPATSLPTTPTSQRRSLPIFLRPRTRRRSKSSSGSTTTPISAEDEESPSSPEELFSWTLALTAQHTAVLVATERLITFLESGVANVSKEEMRRRDARASWWDQGRGEFENVELIQSLLGRPRRTFGQTTADHKIGTTTNATVEKSQGNGDEAAPNLTPIVENDDGRSETVISDTLTSSTLTLTPTGLTARPRHHPMGSSELASRDGFSVRRVCTDPLISSSSSSSSQVALPSDEVRLSRMETFGSEKPSKTPFSLISSNQRPLIATSPMPFVDSVQRAQSERQKPKIEPGCEGFSTSGFLSEDVHLAAGGGAQKFDQSTPLFTPNAGPEKPSIAKRDSMHTSAPDQTTVSSPPILSSVESVYTPYTPLEVNNNDNNNNNNLFAQRALLASPTTCTSSSSSSSSKTFQPLIRELNQRMIISPGQGVQNVAMRVSPIEARSRVSIAPRIEGGPNNTMVVSPVDDIDSGTTTTQPFLGVSPIATPETVDGEASQDDADGHMAWLVYLEQKQKVYESRWSLGRANTSGF